MGFLAAAGKITEKGALVSDAAAHQGLFTVEAATVRCPYPAYAHLRADHPVQWLEPLNAYAVTRYDDIIGILARPGDFSSRRQSGPGAATPLAYRVMDDPGFSDEVRGWARRRVEIAESAPVLVSCDPPRHAQQRKLVNRTFLPRQVAKLEPAVQQITDDLIGRMAPKGSADLVREFAVPLPMTVIANVLGIPDSEVDTFKRWSDAFVMANGNPSLTHDDIADLFRGMNEFYDFFTEQLEDRRRAPRGDLVTDVAQAEITDGEPLTFNERLQMLAQFLIAGNETTTSLIASAVLILIRDSALKERLTADPSRIPAFLEEVLRLESPTQGLFRIANIDTEIAGVQIPKGSFLWLVYASANRDERVFPDSDELMLDRRSPRNHLTFSQGEHVCLGSHLARTESRIAIQALLTRLTDLRLAPGEDGDDYYPNLIQHGLRQLNVEFTPSPWPAGVAGSRRGN
jgi:cytochrome P450